jgi:hypothetical protein
MCLHKMVAIHRPALGSSGPTLTNIADSVAGSFVSGSVAGSFVPGSSVGSWSNTTTIHTNDPTSGRNESRLITESGHDHTVKVDLAVWASVGAFVGVAVFVGGGCGRSLTGKYIDTEHSQSHLQLDITIYQYINILISYRLPFQLRSP